MTKHLRDLYGSRFIQQSSGKECFTNYKEADFQLQVLKEKKKVQEICRMVS
jgi:hypothetical protein